MSEREHIRLTNNDGRRPDHRNTPVGRVDATLLNPGPADLHAGTVAVRPPHGQPLGTADAPLPASGVRPAAAAAAGDAPGRHSDAAADVVFGGQQRGQEAEQDCGRRDAGRRRQGQEGTWQGAVLVATPEPEPAGGAVPAESERQLSDRS